jgi:hypothetical protein
MVARRRQARTYDPPASGTRQYRQGLCRRDEPGGALIAAGGWRRDTSAGHQEQVYLFDRANGTLVKQIEGLPNGVHYLVFSPDGDDLP